MQTINVQTNTNTYPIYIGKGLLNEVSSLLSTNAKVVVVSDMGVPGCYVECLCEQFACHVVLFEQGEASKNFDTLQYILGKFVEFDLNRHDLVIALGGGVVGDLCGLAASLYMRGISYVQIPTTLLAQVDSSIGGKTAIDFCGCKNLVGSFYPPSMVVVDLDVLQTLDQRQLHNGLVESLKCGLIMDPELFVLIEECCLDDVLEEVVVRSLLVKKEVVERDEFEGGIRKVLNFGHTLGHAIEMHSSLLHGEAVGIGMLAMIDDEILVERVKRVLLKYSLPIDIDVDEELLCSSLKHDKKSKQDGIEVVRVKTLGSTYFDLWRYTDGK